MKIKKLIFLGASGNASVIYSTIIDINKKSKSKIKPIGFLDDKKKSFYKLKNYGKINLRNIEILKKKKDVYFIWTLRSSKLKKETLKKLHELKIQKKRFLTIIHPTANVSDISKIGYGVTIHSLVNIGPKTVIKDHVHIFSQASVGHDTSLNEFSYLAGKSSIGANVKVGIGCFFGINSCVKENLLIKDWSIIGMGSVVLKNVNSYTTVAGNPAKKINKD